VLERRLWHCLEHVIRVNTPGEADGEAAAWISGELHIYLTGFRRRSTAELKLKRVSLGLYLHQSTRPITVCYDDVVLSTEYVGPVD